MANNEGSKKGISKLLIAVILGAVLFFMGMMGAGFYILWSRIPAPPVVATGEGEDLPEEMEEEQPDIGPLYSIGTMIVNLADQGGKRYLRVNMELELSHPEVATEIEKRLPLVRDSILMVLSTKTYQDISTNEGKNTLRTQLVTNLGQFFMSGNIVNVFFTEFVVQ
jgi:flagellar FliL protein